MTPRPDSAENLGMAPQPEPAAFEFLRDDTRRRIRVTARATLHAADLATIVVRQANEGAWSFGILYDLRAIQIATPRADALLVADLVRSYLATHGPRGPVALVTRDARMVGIGQSYADSGATIGLEVQVFWDMADAEQWLDGQIGGA